VARQTQKEREAVGKVLTALAESRSEYHDAWMQKCRRWYSDYRGVVEQREQMAEWRSKLTPPYVFQVIETIVANLVDDTTRFSVKARPRIDSLEEVQRAADGARAMEILLRYEHDVDDYQRKQRPFTLQGSICGLTVAKNLWDFRTTTARELVPMTEEVRDEYGFPTGNVEVLAEVERPEVLRDGVSFEPVNVADFFWHPGSTELQRSKYVIHRGWFTYEELEEQEAAGVYENVTELVESRDQSSEYFDRDDDVFTQNTKKGMIEVLEYWENTGEVITVANRSVVLRHLDAKPYWHGEYPFVVASSMPDLFRIPGISDVEIVSDLQYALWDMMNQRLDNLALINNAIVMMRDDIEDVDDFEFGPQERWLVPGDPANAVTMWSPNPLPAEISINAEKMLKGDLQDITGGMPFMSGTDSQVDNKTATGVSIFTTLGQRRLAAKRQNFQWAAKEASEQQMSLLQQFLRQDRLVQIVGKDGATQFEMISPLSIQGRFYAEVEPMQESLMRQERRAEAQAIIQLAGQLAPLMQMMGNPLNMKEFMIDLLRSFDIEDPERYFTEQQQMPGIPGGPEQGGQNLQGTQGQGDPAQAAQQQMQGNLGTTAGPINAADPSSSLGQAPAQMLQRALAMQGGGRNV
jgi:hypothetical protein